MLSFTRQDVMRAVRKINSDIDGVNWLYKNYPARKGGVYKKARTGFVIVDEKSYPIKALGRFCSSLSSSDYDDYSTSSYRSYFEGLGFLISNSDLVDDSVESDARQKALASVWMRPGQAKFRIDTLKIYGEKCLITGCDTLACIEAAHVFPVHKGGGDVGFNGIPLRADVHRLFDANLLVIDHLSLVVSLIGYGLDDYKIYDGLNISDRIKDDDCLFGLKENLSRRNLKLE